MDLASAVQTEKIRFDYWKGAGLLGFFIYPLRLFQKCGSTIPFSLWIHAIVFLYVLSAGETAP